MAGALESYGIYFAPNKKTHLASNRLSEFFILWRLNLQKIIDGLSNHHYIHIGK